MCKSKLLHCCLMALVLFGLPAFAQAPNGQTPAAEGACDPLKADGVTKGLYGLCVALCEAQGYSPEVPIRESHKRVLANYNKLKTDSDPELPCVASSKSSPPVPAPVVQSCPCWTAAQAGAIDGVLSDGSTAMGWPAPTNNASACGTDPSFPYVAEEGFINGLRERAFIQVVELSSPMMNRCQYQTVLQGQIGSFVSLSIEEGTLTAEQLAACRDDLLARQKALNVCQP